MCIIKRGFSVALVLALGASISSAYGSVDVNTSNEAALESVTGIGTSKARAIVKEREANGPFKDEDDLAARISGLGPKSIAHLRENGLTIGAAVAPGGGAGGGAGSASTSGSGSGAGAARSGAAAASAAAPAPAQAKSAARAAQGAHK